MSRSRESRNQIAAFPYPPALQLIPQARILTAGASLATGGYAFAGSTEAEMKATDAATGQLLAAAVDKRAGGMALSTGF
ncbi:MAG: DUF3313 family protein, partial [Candidatus Binataceae bacterium]